MFRRPSFLRAFVSLAAALCVLLAGVAPSVSRALAAPGTGAPTAYLHDVCTTDTGGGPASGGTGQGGPSHHVACAFCVAHGGSHAAPPPGATHEVRAPGAPPRPGVRGDTRVVAGDWNAAAPRGPPRA